MNIATKAGQEFYLWLMATQYQEWMRVSLHASKSRSTLCVALFRCRIHSCHLPRQIIQNSSQHFIHLVHALRLQILWIINNQFQTSLFTAAHRENSRRRGDSFQQQVLHCQGFIEAISYTTYQYHKYFGLQKLIIYLLQRFFMHDIWCFE